LIYFNQFKKKQKIEMTNDNLKRMLLTSAEADKAKALLTLDLLGNFGVGIGDHSTKDFYDNAEEALRMLIDADERIETIGKYFGGDKPVL
jgi:hypothetical protein